MTTGFPTPSPELFVREIVAGCGAYAPARVRVELDRAAEHLGLARCMDEVLFPALRQIGGLWHSSQLDLEAERLTSETVRGWLEELALSAPEATDAPLVLLACGPADRHSIGLEALGVLLRHQRRRCRVLGAQTSVRALSTAVQANLPGAVVIASHLRGNRPSAVQSLRAAATLGPAIYYAGEAFAAVELRRDVPGTHLDMSLQGACALILDVPPPNRGRKIPDRDQRP